MGCYFEIFKVDPHTGNISGAHSASTEFTRVLTMVEKLLNRFAE
jgi:hypothetical protein